MEAIVLLGAPGAGKGTVAEKIKVACGYEHVSTGDMLRAEIASGSELGKEAHRLIEDGNLVPDDVILGMIRSRIGDAVSGLNFMFDGFPRTSAQAEGLDSVLAEAGGKLKAVFLLDVHRNVILRRLTGRRTCRNCGAVYHVEMMPPRQTGVCDHCGGELYQREDDCEETILNRIAVFEKQTAPLIEFYENKGLLARIDADRDSDEIAADVAAAL